MPRLAKLVVLTIALILLAQGRAVVPTTAGKASLHTIAISATAASTEGTARYSGLSRDRRGKYHTALATANNGNPTARSLAFFLTTSATDDRGDQSLPYADSAATPPRDQAFISEFDKDQQFSTGTFIAPLKTGPPTA